jgi:hypothetical protein
MVQLASMIACQAVSEYRVIPFIGYPRTLNALRVLDEVGSVPLRAIPC